MASDEGNYLVEYARYFQNLQEFVSNLNYEDDRLPSNLKSRTCKDELIGECVEWTLRYLRLTHCPASLLAPLTRAALERVRIMREECTQETFLLPNMVEVVNEVCLHFCGEDNPALKSLPPPPPCPTPSVSACAVKNTRRRMEDRHSVVEDLDRIFNMSGGPTHYYGVFDGHSGVDAAAFCATHMHCFIAQSSNYPSDPEHALRDAFLRTDQLFMEKSNKENYTCGCTALCVLYRPLEHRLYVAWVGDSQASLISQGRVTPLVNPHKPNREDERKRIEQEGGVVLFYGTWRVNGQLAVSRAIGDVKLKPYVSGVPETVSVTLDGTEDFVVLGCDGLWDAVKEVDVATAVYQQLQTNPDDLQGVSQSLVSLARKEGSADNITALVVFLRPPARVAATQGPPQLLPCVAASARNAMDIMDAVDNANNPFLTQSSNGFREEGSRHSADLDTIPGDFCGHKDDDEDEDDDDLGPETDVDAVDAVDDVDDVLLSPSSNPFFEKTTLDKHEGLALALGSEGDDTPASPEPMGLLSPTSGKGADLDNVGESGEESEDEWNYYRVEPTSKPSAHIPDTGAEPEDMGSPLNPNARVFVPTPPGSKNQLNNVEHPFNENLTQEEFFNKEDVMSSSFIAHQPVEPESQLSRTTNGNDIADEMLASSPVNGSHIDNPFNPTPDEFELRVNQPLDPESPSSPTTNGMGIDEEILACSPTKGEPMDNELLPTQHEFELEVSQRPCELDDSDDGAAPLSDIVSGTADLSVGNKDCQQNLLNNFLEDEDQVSRHTGCSLNPFSASNSDLNINITGSLDSGNTSTRSATNFEGEDFSLHGNVDDHPVETGVLLGAEQCTSEHSQNEGLQVPMSTSALLSPDVIETSQPTFNNATFFSNTLDQLMVSESNSQIIETSGQNATMVDLNDQPLNSPFETVPTNNSTPFPIRDAEQRSGHVSPLDLGHPLSPEAAEFKPTLSPAPMDVLAESAAEKSEEGIQPLKSNMLDMGNEENEFSGEVKFVPEIEIHAPEKSEEGIQPLKSNMLDVGNEENEFSGEVEFVPEIEIHQPTQDADDFGTYLKQEAGSMGEEALPDVIDNRVISPVQCDGQMLPLIPEDEQARSPSPRHDIVPSSVEEHMESSLAVDSGSLSCAPTDERISSPTHINEALSPARVHEQIVQSALEDEPTATPIGEPALAMALPVDGLLSPACDDENLLSPAPINVNMSPEVPDELLSTSHEPSEEVAQYVAPVLLSPIAADEQVMSPGIVDQGELSVIIVEQVLSPVQEPGMEESAKSPMLDLSLCGQPLASVDEPVSFTVPEESLLTMPTVEPPREELVLSEPLKPEDGCMPHADQMSVCETSDTAVTMDDAAKTDAAGTAAAAKTDAAATAAATAAVAMTTGAAVLFDKVTKMDKTSTAKAPISKPRATTSSTSAVSKPTAKSAPKVAAAAPAQAKKPVPPVPAARSAPAATKAPSTKTTAPKPMTRPVPIKARPTSVPAASATSTSSVPTKPAAEKKPLTNGTTKRPDALVTKTAAARPLTRPATAPAKTTTTAKPAPASNTLNRPATARPTTTVRKVPTTATSATLTAVSSKPKPTSSSADKPKPTVGVASKTRTVAISAAKPTSVPKPTDKQTKETTNKTISSTRSMTSKPTTAAKTTTTAATKPVPSRPVPSRSVASRPAPSKPAAPKKPTAGSANPTCVKKPGAVPKAPLTNGNGLETDPARATEGGLLLNGVKHDGIVDKNVTDPHTDSLVIDNQLMG